MSNAKSKTTFDELKDRIDGIEESYRPDTSQPEVPDIPPVDAAYKKYDAPTDEELDRLAHANLSDYYEDGRAGIGASAAERAENLAQERKNAQENFDETLRSAQDYYRAAREESAASALRRGMARSSVAQLGQDELLREEAAQKSKLDGDFRARLGEIDAEISEIDTLREEALRDFDLKYAARLTQELNTLKKERAQRMDEVLEYNNALSERLTRLAMDTAEWEQDYASGAADLDDKRAQAAYAAAKKKEEERNLAVYREVSSYLSSLPRKEARQALKENPYFRSVLGSYHFALLHNIYES